MSKILVIDDDPATLDVLMLMFKIEGYHIFGRNSCLNIIEDIETVKPDLILLDVIMGSIDGRDVCRELKQSKHKHVPIILMSVINNFYADINKPMFSDDYIEKPYDLDVMLNKVNVLITKATSAV
ncbi:response regulator transcription factor [Pedobacter mucosus]|uniref:response regulator transcription factor n=1 Tax=Pedobacter mucosus TaxID=2895286 RepID=UPI001EE3BDEB|nr:response regulator [Pedobacter mucosus]UKT62991.1 response regulator [Pedobacter mucosus]